MGERDLKSVDPRDFGLESSGAGSIPAVLRDERGKIRWRFNNLSDQENLQIAIRNVQALFLEKFPEFTQLFPFDENGLIVEEKKVEARNFILDKLSSNEKFKNAIGSSALMRVCAPYFRGSVYVAIGESFSSWGLEFPFIDGGSFQVDDEGVGWAAASYLVEEFSLDYSTVLRNISGVSTIKSRGKNGHPITLYSHQEATNKLSEYLRPGGLPRVARGNAVIELNGDRWVSVKFIRSHYRKTNNRTLKKLLSDAPFIEGLSANRKVTIFYKETEVLSRLQAWDNLPKVRESGVYCDPNGQEWAPLDQLVEILGISYPVVKPVVSDTDFLLGRNRNNMQIRLYNVQAVRAKFANLQPLTKLRLGPDGSLVDENGEVWVTKTYVKNVRIGPITKISQLEGVVSRIERVKYGTFVFYKKSELEKVFQDITRRPSAHKETGIFVDETGDEWMDIASLAEKLQVGTDSLRYYLKSRGIPMMRGYRRNGGVTSLWRIKGIQQINDIKLLETIRRRKKRLIESEEANKWLSHFLREDE